MNLEADREAILGDWKRVGDYIRRALIQKAEVLGADVQIVAKLAQSEGPLPDTKALEYLENNYPGSAREVIDLAMELQSEELNQ